MSMKMKRFIRTLFGLALALILLRRKRLRGIISIPLSRLSS